MIYSLLYFSLSVLWAESINNARMPASVCAYMSVWTSHTCISSDYMQHSVSTHGPWRPPLASSFEAASAFVIYVLGEYVRYHFCSCKHKTDLMQLRAKRSNVLSYGDYKYKCTPLRIQHIFTSLNPSSQNQVCTFWCVRTRSSDVWSHFMMANLASAFQNPGVDSFSGGSSWIFCQFSLLK